MCTQKYKVMPEDKNYYEKQLYGWEIARNRVRYTEIRWLKATPTHHWRLTAAFWRNFFFLLLDANVRNFLTKK